MNATIPLSNLASLWDTFDFTRIPREISVLKHFLLVWVPNRAGDDEPRHSRARGNPHAMNVETKKRHAIKIDRMPYHKGLLVKLIRLLSLLLPQVLEVPLAWPPQALLRARQAWPLL